MSRDVVTVAPDTPLKTVAELLVAHRIAGVPVCNSDGRVVGVVSEADILWKELGVGPERAGIVDRVLESAYGQSTRLTAVTAGEAMTTPAVTITPQASIGWAAELMTDLRINRLPVVEEDKLVGIIARADLVRAFSRPDEELEREITQDVLLHTLWVDPDTVSLLVTRGIVTIAGEVENHSTAKLIEAYIRRVPGVVSVRADLRFQFDDLARRVGVAADQLQRQI